MRDLPSRKAIVTAAALAKKHGCRNSSWVFIFCIMSFIIGLVVMFFVQSFVSDSQPTPFPPFTLTLTPTPSASITPTPTLTPVPARALVKIRGQEREVPPACPIMIEAKTKETIRIEVILQDADGQRVLSSMATYHWCFEPEDPQNASRVGPLNNVLNYTAPTSLETRLVTIYVEAASYCQKIVILIKID